ncbi:hypothetical protein ID741_000762 [Enterococcus sp. AZ103]
MNENIYFYLAEKKIDMAHFRKYYGKWYCLPHESPGNSSVCQTFETEIGGRNRAYNIYG